MPWPSLIGRWSAQVGWPHLRRADARAAVYLSLAFAVSQSLADISRKPLPLQEFCPLQALAADLQLDWPLQAFTPSQCIFAASALATVIGALLNSSAAAVAIAAPETFFEIDMGWFLGIWRRPMNLTARRGWLVPGEKTRTCE